MTSTRIEEVVEEEGTWVLDYTVTRGFAGFWVYMVQDGRIGRLRAIPDITRGVIGSIGEIGACKETPDARTVTYEIRKGQGKPASVSHGEVRFCGYSFLFYSSPCNARSLAVPQGEAGVHDSG